MSANRPELRKKLIRQQENRCFFCYRDMLPAGVSTPLAASLFSLDDRHAPWRGRYSGHIRHVAACHECCRFISDMRQSHIPLEELHRRARPNPQPEIGYEVVSP